MKKLYEGKAKKKKKIIVVSKYTAKGTKEIWYTTFPQITLVDRFMYVCNNPFEPIQIVTGQTRRRIETHYVQEEKHSTAITACSYSNTLTIIH